MQQRAICQGLSPLPPWQIGLTPAPAQLTQEEPSPPRSRSSTGRKRNKIAREQVRELPLAPPLLVFVLGIKLKMRAEHVAYTVIQQEEEKKIIGKSVAAIGHNLYKKTSGRKSLLV